MFFDEYYSVYLYRRKQQSPSPVCSKTNTPLTNPASPNSPNNAIVDSATIPTLTHLGQRWNPVTYQWTLWTLRDALLFNKYGGLKNMCGWPKLSIPKSEFLETVSRRIQKVCPEFNSIPYSAIVVSLPTALNPMVKSRVGEVYPSDQILYGESFVYSHLSDTVTINGNEINFETHGKQKIKETLEDHVHLRACHGLAQILAACTKPEDIFIIVGRGWNQGQGEGTLVPLNLVTNYGDQNYSLPNLQLIRLCFDVLDNDIRMVEKINPFKEKSEYFTFKYVCMDLNSRYVSEVIRHRYFSLQNGVEPAGGFFYMPVTRNAKVSDAYEVLLAGQYKMKRFRRRSLNSSSSSTISTDSGLSSSPEMGKEVFRLVDQFHRRSTVPDHPYPYSKRDHTDEKEFTPLQITILKIFLCTICPMVVLVICICLFQPVIPVCRCGSGESWERIYSVVNINEHNNDDIGLGIQQDAPYDY